MTNMILTPRQKQGRCPEYGVREARCKNDSQCVAGKVPRNGHGKLYPWQRIAVCSWLPTSTFSVGIMTGKCIEAERSVTKMCEVQTWCPVERNRLPMSGTNFGKSLTKLVTVKLCTVYMYYHNVNRLQYVASIGSGTIELPTSASINISITMTITITINIITININISTLTSTSPFTSHHH
jgi:hypothetical protein